MLRQNGMQNYIHALNPIFSITFLKRVASRIAPCSLSDRGHPRGQILTCMHERMCLRMTSVAGFTRRKQFS